MVIVDEHYISGWKTANDWMAFRNRLVADAGQAVWHTAYDEFFFPRLQLRYFDPIKVLQQELHSQGEGFSIVAIQCTLLEFIESTFQGLRYRFLRRGEKLRAHEYNISSSLFVNFLCNRSPFSKEFSSGLAEDFYKNIRCGLLHEAQTKGGWRIWAEDHHKRIVDSPNKILFRNNFHAALLGCVKQYRKDLSESHSLQEAFVRKLDSLC